MKNLLLFIVTLMVLFAGAELFAQKNFKVLKSFSDPAVFKLELLKKRSGNNLVFLGSSRFLDAVSVEYLNTWSLKENELKLKSFDASFRGPSFDEYLFSIKEILKIKNTDFLVLEWSNAVFSDHKKKIKEVSAGIIKKTDSIENSLQSFVLSQSALVRLRKSISLRSLHKYYMLKTSDKNTHDLWLNPRIFKNIYTEYKHQSKKDLSTFKPEIWESLSTPEVHGQPDKIVRLVEALDKAKIKVIFVRPPVVKEKNFLGESFSSPVGKFPAKFDKSVFIDYSKVSFPNYLMRDDVHLSVQGKVLFSQILARDLALQIRGAE